MHLTYPDSDGHKAPAPFANADGDGAPEIEIEVTPEMIAAGAAVLCRFETFTASEAYWAEEVYRAMRAAT
jgi:hypothetical protein